MNYPMYFQGALAFSTRDLLDEALIEAGRMQPFAAIDLRAVSPQDLELKFDIPAEGTASQYRNTISLLRNMACYAEESFVSFGSDNDEPGQFSESRTVGECYRNIADACLARKEYAAVVKFCTAAMASGENTPLVFYYRGIAGAELESYDQAAEDFEKIPRDSVYYRHAMRKLGSLPQNIQAPVTNGASGNRKLGVGEIISICVTLAGLIATIVQYNSPEKISAGVPDTHFKSDASKSTFLSDSLLGIIRKTGKLPAAMMEDEKFQLYQMSGLDSIPSDVWNMKKLKVLSVLRLPISFLPDAIGQVKTLEMLSMPGCALRTLPAGMAGLTGLREIDISNNPLDSLPDIFGGMTQLKNFNLGTYMGAYGRGERRSIRTVPPSIGSLTNLEELNFSGCQLTSLPDTLQNLTSLRIINISGNQIDSLPPWFAKLTNLEMVYMSDNRFSSMPVVLQSMPQLKYVSVKGNSVPMNSANLPAGCNVTW
jgi:hypothetical protein